MVSVSNQTRAAYRRCRGDSATLEIIPFAVETRVGERRTEAGLENRITCQVLDQTGEPIEELAARPEIHPDTGFERTDNGAIGKLARDYEVVCAANALGLRDPTPAVWTVTPGAPVRSAVYPSAVVLNAGDQVEIECEAFDAFGNLIPEPDTAVVFDPPPRGLDRRGNLYRIDGAGTSRCHVRYLALKKCPVSEFRFGPDCPHKYRCRLPERPVYRVGSVVEVVAQATDNFNPVAGDRLESFRTLSSPPWRQSFSSCAGGLLHLGCSRNR